VNILHPLAGGIQQVAHVVTGRACST
jgi:hypothetical protein